MSKKQTQEEVIFRLQEKVKKNDPESIKILVPSFLAKKSVSYMLIRDDLLYLNAAAARLLKYMQEEENEQLMISSLWYAIITIYGKCFTENKGGYSKLTEAVLSSQKQKDTHECLMDLRHGFIAHRDESEKEIAFMYMRLPKNGALTGLTEYKIESSKILSPSKKEATEYLTLFEHLLKVVNDKIEKQTQKAHDTLKKKYTQQNLLSMRF